MGEKHPAQHKIKLKNSFKRSLWNLERMISEVEAASNSEFEYKLVFTANPPS